MGITPQNTLSLKQAAGRGLARLIHFVARTSTIVTEPATLRADLVAAHPVIIATWHGQFMMTCLLKPDGIPVAAMVARHGDAEMIGEAMAAFGVTLIRGAGAGERKKDRGGAHALRAAVTALRGRADNSQLAGLTSPTGAEPCSLVMTADVPPGPARQVGPGIIAIARLSGCPIVPVAVASSRYKAFRTWSRLTLNLPFSKVALVGGAPLRVPRDADAEMLERLRVELEGSLNAVTARAYALAGADATRATPPNPLSAAVRPGVLLATYAGGMRLAQLAAGQVLAARERKGKEDTLRIGERRGIAGLPRPLGIVVWVHATSVGEMNAVLPLIESLCAVRPDIHVLLTTTTVTSAALAATRLPASARHQYIPLDTPNYAARFLDHWKPDLAIFTESEIWPSLILGIARRQIPLALVNGRMSAKSFKLWKRIASVSEPLFSRFDLILAQNEKLARWFRDVGGRRVVPVGNLKADAPPLPVHHEHLAQIKTALAGRPVLLAASTHAGEEVLIADAHRRLTKDLPGFCTLIAPRHPERGAGLADELTGLGFKVARRSQDQSLTAEVDIYIADTIGELGTFYACCPVAFVGGSLIDRGGQNPIEAIARGCALVVGPSTFNFRDEYGSLARTGGVSCVATSQELAATVARLLTVPGDLSRQTDSALKAVAGLKGALPHSLALIAPLLPPPVPDAALQRSAQDLIRAS